MKRYQSSVLAVISSVFTIFSIILILCPTKTKGWLVGSGKESKDYTKSLNCPKESSPHQLTVFSNRTV